MGSCCCSSGAFTPVRHLFRDFLGEDHFSNACQYGKLAARHRLCVIGAYVPQIWHLWCEQCSAGISERAYALWVVSSALFLGHSIIIDDMVFMVTHLVNVIALVVILVLARRFRNQICTTRARQLHVKE